MNLSNKLLSDLVAFRTYAKHIPHQTRRETFEETINRDAVMHLDKFPKLSKDIMKAFRYVHDNRIMPSMRTLQFSGEAIIKNNARGYNCSAAAVDDPVVFSESLFLLLSGVGFGFSVQRSHTNKLPPVSVPREEGYYLVHDSIEGWAQALNMLVEAYFYRRIKPVFDFTMIRPKDSYLVTTGAKAPGPEPLKTMLSEVEARLKLASGRKLRPIEVHDLMCIISDCVLSGGIRRAALISLFDRDDVEMLTCKSGEWWVKHPYRARANNSAMLIRGEVSEEEFRYIFKLCKDSGSGEPGFKWANSVESLANPCQPKYATVLTPQGIKTFGEIEIGDKIWSGNKWTKITNKVNTGTKPVYKYTTSTGYFLGTENHRIVQRGEKIKVSEASYIDWSLGPKSELCKLDPQDVIDGLVLGDGSVHKASNNLVGLYIGNKDLDYFHSEVSKLITRHRPGISKNFYEIVTTISSEELPKTFKRSIPHRFFYGSNKKKMGFLRGLFSANGSICGERVTLKQASKVLITQVQEMLSSLGIHSYITTNKSKMNTFSNGNYQMRESYDLNITSGRDSFKNLIGFIQKYKLEKIKNSSKVKYKTSEIKTKEYIEDTEVFDITVEAEEHTYWTGGCLVSNCNEISLNHAQFCNLSTVNQTGIKNKKDFLDRIYSATMLGTLQAAYTDFPFLRPIWKETTERESLLGVSFTGIADAAGLVTNEWLQEGAKLALEVNEKYARKIGINLAARITTLKPEGSSSCILGSSSGIHARHSEYYLRRFRINRGDSLDNYLRHVIPELVEDDIFSNTGSVITIPQESPKGALLRENETALSLLQRTYDYNMNWIKPGHRSGLDSHNVSVTVSVKEGEWEEVCNSMWDNREKYNGISLLPYDGGSYQQAPFETCDKSTFDKYSEMVKSIDLSQIREDSDNTKRSETVACGGGACELTSI